jgi:hypothetical protein
VLTTEAGGKIHGFDTSGKEMLLAAGPGNDYLETVSPADIGLTGSDAIIGLSTGMSQARESICLFSHKGNLLWRADRGPWLNGFRGSLSAAAVKAGEGGVIFISDSHTNLEAYDFNGKRVFPKQTGMDILRVLTQVDGPRQHLISVSGSGITCYDVHPHGKAK